MTDTEKSASPPAQPDSMVASAPTRRAEALLAGAALPPLTAKTTRRGFFPLLGAAWLVFTAGAALIGTTIGRFFFPNVLFEPPSTFKAGFPSEYEVGQVDERFKAKFGVWIVRDEHSIYALNSTCTHLGCPPNWLVAERKFKCPCHGSGFYITGINFEGPAPRPLERYKILVGDDGQLVIDKNQKFQYEKGQWTNPDAFVKV
jgi:cytochrome b6-f complex iron-sulfur subunit